MIVVLVVAQAGDLGLPAGTGAGLQLLLGSLLVLGLLGGWAWVMRRGWPTRRAAGTVAIETAIPLGERRSLVIVTVEGRRLLLGLTPASVALVTTLEAPGPAFAQTLDQTAAASSAAAGT